MAVLLTGVQGIQKNNTLQVLEYLLFALAGQLHHIGHINAGFLCQGQGKRFRSGIHGSHNHLLLDGALREHIRFSDKIALIIQHLQRGQQTEGTVCTKHTVIGPGIDQAIFLAERIVNLVQVRLLRCDKGFRVVLRLIFDQPSGAVPDFNHTLNAALCRCRHIYRIHAAVFPVVKLPIHHCIAEVTHGRVGRNGMIFFLVCQFIQLILCDFRMNILNGIGQQRPQFLPLEGQAGRLRAKGTTDLTHFTQYHIRIVDEILVHSQAIGGHAQVNPVGHNIHQTVTLLQEDNIRSHFRACGTFEGVIGQTDGTQQIGSLGDILSD